ncbi:MAG: AtpZ/AtpI family protein [Bacteroidales bacterium]|nr:AtpZ/AtpI family protein [Bacteroidales bacterium]
MKTLNNPDQKKFRKNLNSYAKYSSLAFQMIFIILAGTFGGIKIDHWLKLEFPIFTILLSFLSVILAMYYAIKDIIKFK